MFKTCRCLLLRIQRQLRLKRCCSSVDSKQIDSKAVLLEGAGPLLASFLVFQTFYPLFGVWP